MYVLPPLSVWGLLEYSRKSRTDDPNLTVEEVLAKHEKILRDWVDRNLPGQGPIPEENRYHEVVSGETIDSRPRMKELLKRIESPEIKGIVCVEPQRLSRGDLEDIGRLVKLLRYTNTIVITPTFVYDLRDDHDRDSFERELKRGNEYLEYSKKIMARGRKASVESGHYLSIKPPYGYDRITIKEGNRKCHTLTPNPEQAPVVKMIFEWYREGLSSQKICDRLNEMGIKSSTGGKWRSDTLSKLRQNVHYIGMVAWDYRKTVHIVENGEVIKSRPRNKEFMVFPGKHEAIIDQELWDAVQEIVNKVPPVKSKRKYVNEFAGILYCSCGAIMQRREFPNKRNTQSRLECTNVRECKTASCIADVVRDEVIKALQEAIDDFNLRIDNDTSTSYEMHEQLVASLEKKMQRLEAMEIAQWEKYTTEGMPKHIFDTLNEKVIREKAEVEHALCVAKDAIPEQVDYAKKAAMFSDALACLKDPNAPVLQKNLLLKNCIEKIIYTRKREELPEGRVKPMLLPVELEIHLRV